MAGIDPFGASGLDDPYSNAEAVTPNNNTDNVPVGCRGLYIGGAGAVAVTMRDGSSATLAAVPVGSFLPLRVTRVLSTGTTATNIVAFS